MKVMSVPCLEDNYAYLVYGEETGDAAAIDPVWPDQVLHAAQSNGAKVKMVLTTHHHCSLADVADLSRGAPDQMYKSLCKTLASHPRETQVQCGHEHAQTNLEFALTLGPKNEVLVKKMEWVVERRKQKLETVLLTIGNQSFHAS